MSTEHQQYSIENQIAAIAEYASSHDFEVIRTYSDHARSGIDLAHRPGLRQMLDDITEFKADFRAVLVYDISRWGRFQDADESACYEFLCRRTGVNVVYCAEPFANDLSMVATLLKTLKRTMAGEYLRELSTKVFAGQCRIVQKGYKAGGPCGYGLRRLLLTPDGDPKMVLHRGERKSLITERVTYVPGPPDEIRVVKRIYSLFLDSRLNCHAIARWLNKRGLPREEGYKWNGQMIHTILSHEKYIGSIVFNQKSGRLGARFKSNPREQWVIRRNSFPPIISRSRFELAQRRLNDRTIHRSNERLLEELRAFVKRHGRATQAMLAADPRMAKTETYAHRFGSLCRALESIKTEPKEGFSEIECRARLKMWLQDEFARIASTKALPYRRFYGVFRSAQHPTVVIEVGSCIKLPNGNLRWQIRYPAGGVEGMPCICLRMQPNNKLPMDYVCIPRLPYVAWFCQISEERIRELGFIAQNLDDAVERLLVGYDPSLYSSVIKGQYGGKIIYPQKQPSE
jgi:DNA invertase Pin-like site-specific DNA recombinase